MKLKNYLLLAGAALMMVSCSQEDVFNPGLTEGESTVSFTINLSDQMQTRSYGDGTTAKFLQYQLYNKKDDGSYEKVTLDGYSGKISDFNLSTILSFQLLNGNTYKLVAVADKFGKTSNGAYYVSFGNSSVTIGTANLYKSQLKDEGGDIFYASEEFTVNGDLSGVIELKRAVAQINFGTNDYEEAESLGFEGLSAASIQIRSYMTFNAMTSTGGTLWSSPGNTFSSDAYLSKDTETFPVEGYKYIAMAYVFVNDEKELYDITLSYTPKGKTKQTINLASVPVQRNHRTNIYGSVLTSNYDLTLEIEPMFEEPAYTPDDLATALAFGGTVALQNDIEISKQAKIDKNTTIDFNGKKITSNIAPSSTTIQQVPLYVTGGGNLTLKGDSEGSGMNTSADATSFLVGVSGGTVTVESGTYTSDYKGPLFYIGEPDGGTVYIKGGTFKSGYTKEDSQSFLLNCEDAAYNKGTAKFVVTGGKFYNFNPEHSNAEPGLDHSWVAPGYKVISYAEGEDMVYIVVPDNAIEANTSDALTQAFSNVSNGDVILVTGDCSTAVTSNFPKGVDFTIKGVGAENSTIVFDYADASGSSVTFEDITVHPVYNSTNHTGTSLKGAKDIVFNNCNLACEFSIYDGNNATFNECTFTYNGNTDPANGGRYGAYIYGGNVEINNCVFDQSSAVSAKTKGILIYPQGTVGDVTVNNCNFIGGQTPNDKNAAIEIHTESTTSAGKLTINGCTFDSDSFPGGLWQELHGTTREKSKFFEVWVDGSKVQDRENP
ncbi:MAG: hypothetical protein J1E82_01160 [Muribaculaceae bacterium]|nr:hypothetical protein [Muribaculaceae bacterium]